MITPQQSTLEQKNLQDYRSLKNRKPVSQYDTGRLVNLRDKAMAMMRESGNSAMQNLQSNIQQPVKQFTEQAQEQFPNQFQGLGEQLSQAGGKILEKLGPVTQRFGAKSPVEKFSGGINYGTDIAVPKGTKLSLPPGQWQIMDAYNQATASGPGNKQAGQNKGYGNSILAKNMETGEILRFSHLSDVGVQPGQTLLGGTVIGATGATGNVAGQTGQHLDIEYYDALGKIGDVLQSRYASFLT